MGIFGVRESGRIQRGKKPFIIERPHTEFFFFSFPFFVFGWVGVWSCEAKLKVAYDQYSPTLDVTVFL